MPERHRPRSQAQIEADTRHSIVFQKEIDSHTYRVTRPEADRPSSKSGKHRKDDLDYTLPDFFSMATRPSEIPLNARIPLNTFPVKETPLTLERAVSEIQKISKLAKRAGLTPMEVISQEQEKGNPLPLKALLMLDAEKTKHDKMVKKNEKKVKMERPAVQTVKTEPVQVPLLAKKVTMFVAERGLNYAGGMAVEKATEMITGKTKLVDALSLINKVSHNGEFTGKDLVGKVALNSLMGNDAPQKALDLILKHQGSKAAKFLTSEAGGKIVDVALKEVTGYGIAKALEVIWNIIKLI